MKFSFDEYNLLCPQSEFKSNGGSASGSGRHTPYRMQAPMTEEEEKQANNESREKMESIAKSLIIQMGGEVVPYNHKFAAEHWVYYKRL